MAELAFGLANAVSQRGQECRTCRATVWPWLGALSRTDLDTALLISPIAVLRPAG